MQNEKFTNTALFLDRDGIINHDFGYVYQKEKLKLVDGIIDLINYFSNLVDYIIVVSNQSGIGRGYYSFDDWMNFNGEIQLKLNKSALKIDAFYCCPHKPEFDPLMQCNCRKPNPGMLIAAQNEFLIDLEQSILIGDKLSDIEAAKNAGIMRAYLLTPDDIYLSDCFPQFDACSIVSLNDIIIYEKLKKQGITK